VTAASAGEESRDRVAARLINSVPGLGDGAVRGVLATARAEHGRALREIDALLKEHPEALVTTPAAYPLVLVRLAHALIAAGYLTVTPPACTGCGRITADLRRKTATGRVCGTCAARDSKGTYARCGQARRIYARRPEGGICSACYDKDEQVVTECSGCGRMRRAAARMPDGSARCQFCAMCPVRTCSACGQQRTVAGTIDKGSVCASCYQAPQRPCGRCGRTRKIAKRATASTPDLCYGCYQGAWVVCSVCGSTRPCQRISSGARSAGVAGPALPGPASGAGATVPSRRNGPPDRSVSGATSMSAATLANARAAGRRGR
jgi:hypothetical protein